MILKSHLTIHQLHCSTGRLSRGVTYCLSPSGAAFVFLTTLQAVTKNKEHRLSAQTSCSLRLEWVSSRHCKDWLWNKHQVLLQEKKQAHVMIRGLGPQKPLFSVEILG